MTDQSRERVEHFRVKFAAAVILVGLIVGAEIGVVPL